MNRAFRIMVAVCLLTAVPSFAQIVVEGVSDQQELSGPPATFRVLSEGGYTYYSTLDERHIDEDVWIDVALEGYHEILVTRTNDAGGGPLETELVRFCILSSRGEPDWGLHPWTPLPPIDSSSNECASARLLLVAPSDYPADLDIPVVAIMEDDSGAWKRINGTVEIAAFPGNGIPLRRGVGHTFITGQSAGASVSADASIKSVSTNKTITIDTSTSWTTVSSDITDNTDWPDNSRIRITSNITVEADSTLTIGKGSVVRVSPDVEITVDGTLDIAGTLSEPVVFTPQNSSTPWGGLIINSEAHVVGAIFTGSGADDYWLSSHGYDSHRNNQCVFLLETNSLVTLTNVFLVRNAQAFHGEEATLIMNRSLVQECVSGGQFNGGLWEVDNCAFVDFPYYDDVFLDKDNDGLYLNYGTLTFLNSLVGWAKDDGIDAGTGGGASTVVISNCWVEACFHEGLALSRDKTVYVDDTVVVNCGQGIEAGFGNPLVMVRNSITAHNEIGLRFGDNYERTHIGFLQVTNSMSLGNFKDVWNFCPDIWAPRYDRTHIVSNLFSKSYSDYPSNSVWNPQTDFARLAPFIETASVHGLVGAGFVDTSASGTEATTSLCVTVALSMFSTGSVDVAYVIGGTAAPGEDFLPATTNGTITFEPGELVKSLYFTIIDDGVPELIETIEITLTAQTSPEIQPDRAVFVYSLQPSIHFVSKTGNDEPPYTTWENAARNIEDAAAIAADGSTVLVTNGEYVVSSEIRVSNGVMVQSIEGAGKTIVNGGNTSRCFYVEHPDAVVDGFTLTQGRAEYAPGIYIDGGGTVRNCVISNNYATGGEADGGGVYVNIDGLVENCAIVDNTADDDAGGICFNIGGVAENCLIAGNSCADRGGGVYLRDGGTLRNCIITNNSASGAADAGGGGVWCGYGGRLENCVLAENHGTDGGGVYARVVGRIINCTITANSADRGGGVHFDRGAYASNSVIYFNTAAQGDNWYNDSIGMTYSYCCTTPEPTVGNDNITNEPAFVDAASFNYRLQQGSQCIDAGADISAITCDMDYLPRPLDGRNDGTPKTDIGAYEYLNPDADTDSDQMPDGWEQANSLNLLQNDAGRNNDNDRFSNLDEYTAGTDPNDPNSFFRITDEQILGQAGPAVIYWESSDNRSYRVYSTTNMFSPWTNIFTVSGNGTTKTYTNTDMTAESLFFRLGVSVE